MISKRIAPGSTDLGVVALGVDNDLTRQHPKSGAFSSGSFATENLAPTEASLQIERGDETGQRGITMFGTQAAERFNAAKSHW